MIDPELKLSEASKGRLMRGIGLVLAIWASPKSHPETNDPALLTRARGFVAFLRGQ